MKPKARISFSFLADHEIAFPSCRHNFEEKHCRRCSNHCNKHNFEGRRCSLTTSFLGVNKHCCHYLVPSNRNQTTPISLVFRGCSLVIEGEPNRALCRLVAGGG